MVRTGWGVTQKAAHLRINSVFYTLTPVAYYLNATNCAHSFPLANADVVLLTDTWLQCDADDCVVFPIILTLRYTDVREKVGAMVLPLLERTKI